MIEKGYESKQEINIETYVKKIKRKRENTEKIDIIICLKKKSKRVPKKKYQEAKKSKNNNE